MSKKAYVGVGDTARKVNKMYVGVGGTARKVVKGYIGVNGVARQFWPSGGIIGDWDVNKFEFMRELEVGHTYEYKLAPFEDVCGYLLHKTCYTWPTHIEPYLDTIEDSIKKLVEYMARYLDNTSPFKNYFRDVPFLGYSGFTGSGVGWKTLFLVVFIPTSSVSLDGAMITAKENHGGVEYFATNKTITYRRIYSHIMIDTQSLEYPYEGRTYQYNYFGRELRRDIGFGKLNPYASNVEAIFTKEEYPKDGNIFLQWGDFSQSLFDITDNYTVDPSEVAIDSNGLNLSQEDSFVKFPLLCTAQPVIGNKALLEVRIAYANIDDSETNSYFIFLIYPEGTTKYTKALKWDGTEWLVVTGYKTTSGQSIYWQSQVKTGIKDVNFFNDCLLGITGEKLYKNRQLILRNFGLYYNDMYDLYFGFPTDVGDASCKTSAGFGIKNAVLYTENISIPDIAVGAYIGIEDLSLEWTIRSAIDIIKAFSRPIIRESSQGQSWYDNTLGNSQKVEQTVQLLLNNIDNTYHQFRITIEIIKIQYYGGYWDWGQVNITLWYSHQGSSAQGGKRKVLSKTISQDNTDYIFCTLQNNGVLYPSLSRRLIGFGSSASVTDISNNQTWVSDSGVIITTQENEALGGIYDIQLVLSNIKFKEV